MTLIHQHPVGQRPFVPCGDCLRGRLFASGHAPSCTLRGCVPGVWVGRLTVRLALQIPGFSAADHVESPTNPGRRRSAYVPTQPHQSKSSRRCLLLEEPVEELGRGERGSAPFFDPKTARGAVNFWGVFGPAGPLEAPKARAKMATARSYTKLTQNAARDAVDFCFAVFDCLARV